MNIFFNHCFDKRRFSQFIQWFFKTRKQQSAHYSTIIFLEKLKYLGFQSAMKAGFSISLEDLKIPASKSYLLQNAERWHTHLTTIEASQAILEIWNRTCDQLKQQVVQSFQISELFNPVYIMAFSGARGNISQIRQLLALRGLMADPLGQIIDFPIRSNFREGLTLTEYLICCSGARKGIVDTALRTASSGYLTRRLVDVAHHVVISQIDCETKKSIALEDLYEQNSKKILSLNHRLIGRILAQTVIDSTGDTLGYKNQEISKLLSKKICQLKSKILIRSPLTCESPQFVCQLCYGWNLAEGQLVSIGEAVGVLAAQSIGEPGTQLTMRTFHTGGVFTGSLIDQTYSPFSGIVHYPYGLQGTGLLIRTQRGQIAFLSKNPAILEIYDSNNQKTQFDFPGLTLLYASQGQSVEKNQLLAERAPFGGNFIENEHHILCCFSGELYFENLVFIEKNELTNKIVQGIGEFWILFGQILVTSKWKSNNFLKKLDLINAGGPPFFQIEIESIKKTSSNRIFQTQFQQFQIDLIFFKKSAYFHNNYQNIQTFMAGVHLQSKYKVNKTIFVHNLVGAADQIDAWSGGGIFYNFYYEFQKTCHFFYPHFCIINLNRQGDYLLNLSSCLLFRKNSSWGFFHYCFNLFDNWQTYKQVCLFNWQKAAFFNKFYFLLVFFNKFQITSQNQNWQNKLKLGSQCFLRIQIFTLGFSDPFFQQNSRIPFYFEKFFIQNIWTPERVPNPGSSSREPINQPPWQKWNCYLLNNKFRYSLKIQKRVVDFYFDSFLLTLTKSILIKNFQTRFNSGKFSFFQKYLEMFKKFQLKAGSTPFILLDNQTKFIANLNSVNFIKNGSKLLSNSLNLKLTIRVNKLIKQFQNQKCIQIQSQFFMRFFTPIKMGEVVDLIDSKNVVAMGSPILIMSFEHLFCYKLKPGNILGSVFQKNVLNHGAPFGGYPGQLIAQTHQISLFRGASIYLLNNQNIIHGDHGEIVFNNQRICTVFYNQSKTGDIVQGIPKIEYILEARKKYSIFSKQFDDFENTIQIYLIKIQKSVLNNIQRIYCGQGIHISDKHIEIIVRQITSNVMILDPGQTGLLWGEIVPLQWISRMNSILVSNQILYEPLLMGMTKTCLQTSSFISAASFQETTSILSQAALQNQIDFLRGLKQNVILGNIIPAGTGY